MEPIILDCKALEWQQLFSKHAAEGKDIDLIHFQDASNADFCENIARHNGMRLMIDSEHDTAFLRKTKED